MKPRDFRTAVEAIVELECMVDPVLGGTILAPREIKNERDLPDTKEGAILQRVIGLLDLAEIEYDMTRFSIPYEMPSQEWLYGCLLHVGGDLLGLEWIDASDVFEGPSRLDHSRARQEGGR